MAESKNYWFYKIHCVDEQIKEVYVGHTTNLNQRLRNHKAHCNNETDLAHHTPLYKFIREHGGWSNWKVTIIDDGIFESLSDAESRERYHIQMLGASLNVEVPGRTREEYREERKAFKKDYDKQFRDKNKERIKAKESTQYECSVCKCQMRLKERNRHEQSMKHKNNLQIE